MREKISFVVVDYLGYMSGSGKDCYERVSGLSKDIKAFAKECKVAVLVLHQLSREALSGGEPVSLRMCRDSGVFEESCDYLLGAWRPELSEKATEEERFLNQGLIKVAILKNRCGGNKTIDFWLNSENLRIEEMQR
ncbi:MAG: DnaB-like helicase C-terminal domain-containing protein [Actinomycetota bacterium]